MDLFRPIADDRIVTDTQAPPAPEPGEPAESPRRLTRSRSDRVLAGVAGGLGRHFGVDPVVFRIGFVAFSLLGGAGLVVYGLAWLLVPEDGAHRTLGEYLLRRAGKRLNRVSWPTVAGIVLLIAAAAFLLGEAVRVGEGQIVGSVALLAAGTALLVWRRGLSVLTRITVGLLLVGGGAVGLSDAAGLFEVTIEEFLAGALAFTGLVLVASTWCGRARGLLVVGALLTLALGFFTAVDVPLSAGFGERTFRPERVSEVRHSYRLFAGEMLLDLSTVDFPEGTTAIDVDIAFGELEVVTPHRSAVVVSAKADAGELRVLGDTEDGVGAETTRRTRGRDGSTIRLDLHVIGGEIEVHDATS